MAVQDQVDGYIADQSEPKRGELQTLHALARRVMPEARLWFLDGRDDAGKAVTNPNIGYGAYTITYAGGKTREFYRVGFSANTGGISVYIMGLDDKTFLARTYGDRIGRASVTGYCIRFKRLQDIDIDVLEEAIRHRAQLET